MRVAEQKSRTDGKCPCCGKKTRKSTGVVALNPGHERYYIVRWTHKNPEDNMAFLVSSGIKSHFISVLYSFEHNSFMVVGGEDYDWEFDDGCSILEREEVIGTPLAEELFAIIDVIWMQDRAVRRFHRKWTK